MVPCYVGMDSLTSASLASVTRNLSTVLTTEGANFTANYAHKIAVVQVLDGPVRWRMMCVQLSILSHLISQNIWGIFIGANFLR